MFVTEAEKIMLHCASCRVTIDSAGHNIAMLMDTRVPMAITLLSLSLAVSALMLRLLPCCLLFVSEQLSVDLMHSYSMSVA